MSVKVKSGEKREKGWLYFVKGDKLEIFKAKMARGGKKKKKAVKKKVVKKKVVKKKPAKKKVVKKKRR